MSERLVKIVARDLFFRAKLEAIARRAGWQVSRADTPALAVVELSEEKDLGVVRGLVSSGVQVLAYGAHVNQRLLRAARRAGAEVVPNSRLESAFRELLSRTPTTGRGA